MNTDLMSPEFVIFVILMVIFVMCCAYWSWQDEVRGLGHQLEDHIIDKEKYDKEMEKAKEHRNIMMIASPCILFLMFSVVVMAIGFIFLLFYGFTNRKGWFS